MPVRPALIWTIVAGYLILPSRVGFDLPALPVVDKNFVPVTSAAIMCMIFGYKSKTIHATKRPATPPRHQAAAAQEHSEIIDLSFTPKRGKMFFWALMTLSAISPFMTIMQNADPVAVGAGAISGLKPYDALSIGSTLLVSILPFFLGRRYLASEVAQKLLLKILAAALLFYSVLIAYEIRMSPQLNTMIYGFFPHSWLQHVRGDGFRPLVFLPHGLWLSILVAMAIAAAFAVWRSENNRLGSGKWFMVGTWLFAVLLFSHSLGAFALALVFLSCNSVSAGEEHKPWWLQCLLSIVLLYPMMRSADLIPVNTIHNVALKH